MVSRRFGDTNLRPSNTSGGKLVARKKITARDLQAKTLRKATHQGSPWETDDVARMVAGIHRDETTFELAMALGRSYYATQTTRRMVGFALRHKALW